MKIHIAFAVLLSVVASSQAISEEEKKVMESQILSECKGKEGGTEDDVQTLMNRERPTTKSAKCMAACIGESLGLMKDNKSSVEGNIDIAKLMHPGNEEALKLATTIATACEKVTDSDRCELAVKLMQCSEEVAIAHGWDPKNLM